MSQSTTATPLDDRLLSPEDRLRLAPVCERHRITWLAVFGSVARGEASADSDVDLLVRFEPDAKVSYLDLERVADDLSPFFGGRRVDIGAPEQIHWFIRDRAMAEARVVYAR